MVGDGSGGSDGRIGVAVGTGDGVRVGTGVRVGVAGAAVGTGVAAAFGTGVGASVGTGVAGLADAGVSVEAGDTTRCVGAGAGGAVAGATVFGAADSTVAESDTAVGLALGVGAMALAVGETLGALNWKVLGDASPLDAKRAKQPIASPTTVPARLSRSWSSPLTSVLPA
jgi:hypothetical protein